MVLMSISLTVVLYLPLKDNLWVLHLSCASLLQVISVVMPFDLCMRGVSQAPQHFCMVISAWVQQNVSCKLVLRLNVANNVLSWVFSSGFQDPEINCFDIRNPEKVLYVMYRYVATNQRMYFDVDGWENIPVAKMSNVYHLEYDSNRTPARKYFWEMPNPTCRWLFIQLQQFWFLLYPVSDVVHF